MNNIDGWTLVLNVLKEKDKASSVVLKMLVPVGINNKALLLYSNKEFVRIIFKEKVESLSPLIESITGLHPELTEKNGRRIKVPIIEKDEKIEIIARLKRIIFRNEDFYILSFLTDNGDEITAKGQSVLHLAEDMQYRLNGRWTKHPKYGRQVEFFYVEPVVESDIVKFLSSGIIKGIKKSTAISIVKTLGDDTLHILDSDIDRLREVKGIGKKTLAVIKKSYTDNIAFRDVTLFFSKYSIPLSQIYKMFKAYGAEAVQVVSQNPYRLIEEIDGVGFTKADKIAEQLSIEKTDPYRVEAGVKFILKRALLLGNVYLPREELLEKAIKMLDVDKFNVDLALDSMESIVDDNNNIYIKSKYEHEVEISKHFKRIWKSAKSLKYKFVSNVKFSKEQIEAIKNVFKYGISVITGPPGTGKTTVIKSIVNSANSSGYSIALASPTGKAAMRMEEVSEHYAQTIHRLVGLPDNFHKIKNDIIVIDESSMLDIDVAFYLLSALKSGVHIVFVGDEDQLPSVGPGKLLSDIIPIFPTTFFTHIYRQGEGSGIAINAKRINNGEWILPSKDFVFINKEEERDALNFVLDYAKNHRDIQILAPMRKGILGVRNLNRELQAALNPFPDSEIDFLLRKFKSGDRIMQLHNNYEKKVMNGETGTVAYADEKGLQADFHGKTVSYKKTELDEIGLAYASTIHKFQGSETGNILIVIHTSHSVMLRRRLLYTAVTRAKQRTTIVGSKKALQMAIRNNKAVNRYSGLRKRIVPKKKTVKI